MIKTLKSEMDRSNLYPPVFFSYPHLRDSVRIVLFNAQRGTEWDKVAYYLTHKEKYVTNEKVRAIIGNPDTSKVSKILKKWVEKGLLIKVETGAKKTVKYRLPAEQEKSLFGITQGNKS